jgi:hypothetical protein
MGNAKRIICAVMLLAALCSSPAGAIPITGTYTGVATGVLDGFPPLEFKSPVSGTIAFATEPLFDDEVTRTENQLEIFSGAPLVRLAFVFSVDDLLIDLSGAFDSLARITLFDDGISQSLRVVQTDICCSFAQFEFISATHNLFSNFDLNTFNPRDIDLLRSSGTFSARFFGGFDVALSSIGFGSLGSVGVPEPASLTLLSLGLLLCFALPRVKLRKRRASNLYVMRRHT